MDSNSLLPSLPPEREGEIAAPELLAWRQAIAQARDSGVWHTARPPQELTLAGVRALRFTPPGEPRGTVLHIHGGGFRLGCPEQVGPFAAALAERCKVTVVCPAYRLAPEHPFPAGLTDAWAVLTALADSTTLPLVLSGDSAGGGIAAGLAALAAGKAIHLAGLVLLSPWLDLTVTSPSYRENAASDPVFATASAQQAAALYLQGVSPHDPLASPLLGSVAGFPPTLVNAGAGEVLVDDARHLHDKLLASNIPVQLQIVKAMEHVAVTRDFTLTGAAETFAALVGFVDRLMLPG